MYVNATPGLSEAAGAWRQEMSPARCVNGSCIIRDAHTVTCSRWIKRWIAFGKHGEENHSEKAMKVYLLAYRSVHSEEEFRKRGRKI